MQLWMPACCCAVCQQCCALGAHPAPAPYGGGVRAGWVGGTTCVPFPLWSCWESGCQAGFLPMCSRRVASQPCSALPAFAAGLRQHRSWIPLLQVVCMRAAQLVHTPLEPELASCSAAVLGARGCGGATLACSLLSACADCAASWLALPPSRCAHSPAGMVPSAAHTRKAGPNCHMHARPTP